MIIATLRKDAGDALAGNTTVEVSATTIAILTAVIAIVPAVVTALTDAFVKPRTQQSTALIENTKLELQRRKESADLFRSALAVEDARKRLELVQFLYTAKLVDQNDNVSNLPADKIPHWPLSPKAPQ